MTKEDCKDSPLESVVQPQQDARRAIESEVQPVAQCLECGFCFLQKCWFAVSKCPECKSKNLALGTAKLTLVKHEAERDAAG